MTQCHKRAFVTPHNKGESSIRIAPELTSNWSEDRPAQVSPPGQVWQDSTARCQRSSAHRVHFATALEPPMPWGSMWCI